MRFPSKIIISPSTFGWMVLGVHEVFWKITLLACRLIGLPPEINQETELPKMWLAARLYQMTVGMILIQLETFCVLQTDQNQMEEKHTSTDRSDTYRNQRRKGNYRNTQSKTDPAKKHCWHMKNYVGSLRGSRTWRRKLGNKSKGRVLLGFSQPNDNAVPNADQNCKRQSKSTHLKIQQRQLKIPQNTEPINRLRNE